MTEFVLMYTGDGECTFDGIHNELLVIGFQLAYKRLLVTSTGLDVALNLSLNNIELKR